MILFFGNDIAEQVERLVGESCIDSRRVASALRVESLSTQSNPIRVSGNNHWPAGCMAFIRAFCSWGQLHFVFVCSRFKKIQALKLPKIVLHRTAPVQTGEPLHASRGSVVG